MQEQSLAEIGSITNSLRKVIEQTQGYKRCICGVKISMNKQFCLSCSTNIAMEVEVNETKRR